MITNLSGINTATEEGQILIAALSKLSMESEKDKEPDEILRICISIAKGIYEENYVGNKQEKKEGNDFQSELTALLNRYSKENGSNTPDYVLAHFLVNCLHAFDSTSKAREKWYGQELKII